MFYTFNPQLIHVVIHKQLWYNTKTKREPAKRAFLPQILSKLHAPLTHQAENKRFLYHSDGLKTTFCTQFV